MEILGGSRQVRQRLGKGAQISIKGWIMYDPRPPRLSNIHVTLTVCRPHEWPSAQPQSPGHSHTHLTRVNPSFSLTAAELSSLRYPLHLKGTRKTYVLKTSPYRPSILPSYSLPSSPTPFASAGSLSSRSLSRLSDFLVTILS